MRLLAEMNVNRQPERGGGGAEWIHDGHTNYQGHVTRYSYVSELDALHAVCAGR